MPEIIPSNEATLQADDFARLVHRVGNHEGKTAIAAFMMGNPDAWFKPYKLRDAAANIQGDDPAWCPKLPIVRGYCQNSFVPGGVAMERKGTFRAQAAFLPQKLAFCGAILGWSLDFPETSVQRVLGFASAGKAYQTTNLKHDICKVIADNNGHEMSFADVSYKLNNNSIPAATVRATIKSLSLSGILETHTLNVTTDVRLQIVDATAHEGRIPFGELDPVTRLVYKALSGLAEQGKEAIDFNDLREQALLIDPTTDQVALRKLWRIAGDRSKNFPGLKRIERKIKDPYKLTTVRFHPTHAEAVNALLGRFADLQANPRTVYSNWRLARSLLEKKAAMKEIFAKTKRFSAHVAKQEEGPKATTSCILAIVQETGTIDIDGVRKELLKAGRLLTTPPIRRYLDLLAEQGEIVREDKPREPSSTRIIRFYSAKPNEEWEELKSP